MRRHLSARWWELVLDLGARLIDVACRHLPPPFPADVQAEIARSSPAAWRASAKGACSGVRSAERGRYRAATHQPPDGRAEWTSSW